MTFIIVAGPLTYYQEIINCYDKYPNVIISTLDNDSIKLDALRAHFPVISTPLNFNPGTGNLNCQTRTTVEGLLKAKEMGATHALKIRSDMIVSDISKFMEMLNKKTRLSFLAWHYHGYLVDYLNYGPIDDMVKFWNVFAINGNFAEKNLMDHFSKVKQEPLNNYKDVKRHVDFFMKDLIDMEIRIHWLKYDLDVSEYYKHECYWYK